LGATVPGQANLTDGIVSITITPAAAGTETITLHYMGDSDDQSSTGTYNLTEVQRIIAIGEAQVFGTVSSQCTRQQTCLLTVQIGCRIGSATANVSRKVMQCAANRKPRRHAMWCQPLTGARLSERI
jgi:hypothetical protein